MSADVTTQDSATGDDHAKVTLMRIVLTILFGGALMLLFRVLSSERSIGELPRRRRPLLTVEEAVRWRPDY